MKKSSIRLTGIFSILSLLITSCGQNTSNSWQEPKTTTDLSESRAIWGSDQAITERDLNNLPVLEDFIALEEEDLKAHFADGAIPQPKHEPGMPGSRIPTIDKFYKPTAYLATIFRNVYFNTDDHILRGKDSLMLIDKMADYLKENPNLCICIEGHCDERGAEAYNLSLGARRANYVRSLLVQKGVDLNQIHTISYGKERPTEFSHTPQAWMKNRRSEFKLFEMK
ncbi:MAG: OmpA family protein [Chlamydiota bacterium]